MSNEIDIEKLRELNESLSELTGTVNVAEKAVEKIVQRLGFGDKLKKKAEEREKAETDVTNVINKETTARERELEQQAAYSKLQQEKFKKELDQRKVAFDSNNELISTAVQLSRSQRETLKLADKLNKAERDKMSYLDAPGKATSGLIDKFSATGAIMKEFDSKVLSLAGNSQALTLTYLGAKAGLQGFVDATASMTKQLYKGERGAMVTANALTALSDAVTPFMKALGPAVQVLSMFTPIGRVLKFASWAATALGFGLESAAKATEVMAKQNDELFKSFNALSESGMTTADGMTGVFEDIQLLGMTVEKDIEKFNALYKNNSKDLKMFGATAADGARAFAEIAGSLYKSEIGEKLELLGVTADQQREHTLQYMAQQTRMGLSLGKTQEQQIAGARAYIEELDRLAMLTGANRKEQEDARNAVLKIQDLRAAQYEAEQRNDTKRAKILEGYANAAAAIYHFDPRGAKGLAEYGAAGGPTGADSSAAMLTYGRGIRAIEQGKDIEEVLKEMSTSAKAMLKQTATTRRIGGDITGLLAGDYGNTVDFVKRMEAAVELQKKEGGSLKDALEKIQKEKEKGLDADTKNNVQAGRRQQAAAMTMESVVKSFNYAADLNAKASEKFNDAVQKFAETVNATPVTGGVPITTPGAGPVSPVPEARDTDAAQKAVREAERKREEARKQAGPDSDEAKKAAAELARLKIEKELALAREERARRKKAEESAKANGGTVIPPSAAEQRRARMLEEHEANAKTPANGKTPASPTPPTPELDKEEQKKQEEKKKAESSVKEKHSAASLKKLGFPLKNDDVQGEGNELDKRIIDIASKAKTLSGFDKFTSFNDKYHSEPKSLGSLHTEGKAFDFKLNYTPTIAQGKDIIKQLKDMGAGYVRDEYNFPSKNSNGKHIHVQLAQDGAAFLGPTEGYPVMLHDKETVLNKIQTDKLGEKLKQVEKKPVETELPILTSPVLTGSTSANLSNKEVVAMLQEFTYVMEHKMDKMIEVADGQKDTLDKILQQQA